MVQRSQLAVLTATVLMFAYGAFAASSMFANFLIIMHPNISTETEARLDLMVFTFNIVRLIFVGALFDLGAVERMGKRVSLLLMSALTCGFVLMYTMALCAYGNIESLPNTRAADVSYNLMLTDAGLAPAILFCSALLYFIDTKNCKAGAACAHKGGGKSQNAGTLFEPLHVGLDF